MFKPHQCAIVGGGLLGMLTAKELVEAGVKVTIVDKGIAGKESSWAGGGILSPLYPWRYADAVNQLCKWSQHHYPALCQQLFIETGIDPQYTLSGLLMLNVAERDAALEWAQRFQYRLSENPADEPELVAQSWQNQLLLPEIAHVRNPRLLQALRAWLEKNGVTFIENSPISALETADGKITAIRTDQNRIAASCVVVAGGAWSQSILSTVDVNIDVFPVQGQMILFKVELGLIKHIIMLDGFYVIPRQDGHVLAGSTLEHRGFDKAPTEAAMQQLKQAAISLVPALANYPVIKHWAGLRPGSPNGIPFIGPVPEVQGLYVNSGHFRNGVVMGAASARLLADIMLNRKPIIDPSPYQLAIQH